MVVQELNRIDLFIELNAFEVVELGFVGLDLGEVAVIEVA